MVGNNPVVNKVGKAVLQAPMSWDEYFMRHVYMAASMSKDPMTKIGAVLVRGKTIISEGYNGFPRGIVDLQSRYEDRPLKRLMTEHGEVNSILNCARNGIKTLGTTMYTQGVPCGNCAGKIIQAGISEIVIHEDWPNLVHSEEWTISIQRSFSMLQEARVTIRNFKGKIGATGLLNGKRIDL